MLTGGDTKIAARFMRQDFFYYDPTFKLMIAGNNKPGLRSVDEAIRRRLHLDPWNVVIPPEERDKKFSEKLRTEWPGILAWMIEGCMQWQQIGLAPPQTVTSATDAYMEAEDALTAWIEEECIYDTNALERVNTLYAAWKAWADRSGEYAGSIKRFSRALEKRGTRRHLPPPRQENAWFPWLKARRQCRHLGRVTDGDGFLLIDAPRARGNVLTKKCVTICHQSLRGLPLARPPSMRPRPTQTSIKFLAAESAPAFNCQVSLPRRLSTPLEAPFSGSPFFAALLPIRLQLRGF